MKHQNVRQKLIEQTILSVANNGLDKTTTKAIVSGTDINEAYIYTYFGNKEDLLDKTFEALDYELVNKLSTHIAIMGERELDFETRCRFYFSILWRFILNNPERSLCFIRYYYSPYFANNSAEAHHERYAKLIDTLSVAFNPKANVWMLLNHVLNVMFDFAKKIFDGALEDNEDSAEHIFRLLYYSISPYINDSIKRNEEKNNG